MFLIAVVGVVARVGDPLLERGRLLSVDDSLLAEEADSVAAVLGNERNDRLARHVAAEDDRVRLVERPRVHEFREAPIRAVNIGGEEDAHRLHSGGISL